MRVIFAALLLVVLAGVGGLAGYEVAKKRYLAPGPLPAATVMIVPHGTADEVSGVLEKAGLIASARDFRIAAILTGGAPLRASEFLFPAGASLRQVLSILRSGKPVQHRLTIPEGLTAAQIANLLEHAGPLTGDVIVPQEGLMLPESYAYEYGMNRAAVIDRAAVAMQRTLDRLWAERDPALPLAAPRDLVILASIVERETARPEERPEIAAVLLNRLKRNMPLQSDPTVIYAVTGGALSGGRTLSRDDLNVDNPYNTYRNIGLPPAPIGSPGLASLQAVARPLATDELYFVADGLGGHAFARTLDEHNRNVAKWRTGR